MIVFAENSKEMSDTKKTSRRKYTAKVALDTTQREAGVRVQEFLRYMQWTVEWHDGIF